MEIKKKLLRLPKIEYYKTHLSIVNCVLPVKMTPKELEILATFLSLEGDIARYRFGPSAKKIVMKELNLKPAGLSNHMSSLLEKGFLKKVGDIVEILPILIPNKEEQQYLFKIVNTDYAPIETQ